MPHKIIHSSRIVNDSYGLQKEERHILNYIISTRCLIYLDIYVHHTILATQLRVLALHTCTYAETQAVTMCIHV